MEMVTSEADRALTVDDVLKALSKEKPEWASKYVRLLLQDTVLGRRAEIAPLASEGSLAVVAAASPFCLEGLQERCQDLLIDYMNLNEADPVGETPFDTIGFDSLADTGFYHLIRKEFPVEWPRSSRGLYHFKHVNEMAEYIYNHLPDDYSR